MKALVSGLLGLAVSAGGCVSPAAVRSLPRSQETAPTPASRAEDPGPPAPSTAGDAGGGAREEAVRILLRAPLPAPRLSFLHSCVDVPPMDTAETLPRGGGFLRLRSGAARSTAEDDGGPGPDDNFDGTYREWLSVEAARVLGEGVEARVAASFTGWDEHVDRLKAYDGSGRGVVFGEEVAGRATSRHLNLSTVVLRGKVRLLGGGDGGTHIALAPSLRLPVGRERDVSHDGAYDAGAALLATRPLGRAAFHAGLGLVAPLGGQNLLERSSDAGLRPFVHGAAGVVLPAGSSSSFALQVEGNSSAFRGVGFLDRSPATAVIGFRTASRSALYEIGAGTGLDRRSSYMALLFASATFMF